MLIWSEQHGLVGVVQALAHQSRSRLFVTVLQGIKTAAATEECIHLHGSSHHLHMHPVASWWHPCWFGTGATNPSCCIPMLQDCVATMMVHADWKMLAETSTGSRESLMSGGRHQVLSAHAAPSGAEVLNIVCSYLVSS